MANRRFSEEDRKSIYATTSDVDWEYHLSKATASRTIRNSLLTIHYLFTERNDYIDRNLTTLDLESLNPSFLNASLAWFRKHCGHQNADDGNKGDDDGEDEEFKGEGFESWCEEVIAAKRDGIIVSPRAQVEGELSNVWSAGQLIRQIGI